MPKRSIKDFLIEFSIKRSLLDIEDIHDDISDENVRDQLEDDILDSLYDDLLEILRNRRGIHYYVPKSKTWTDDILPLLDDHHFRQMLRCNREQFQLLISLISCSAEFQHKNSCQQFSIPFQLAIAMYRLGSSGESATIRKIATLFGIGDGGTVQNITVRVFKAFCELKDKYIFWPDHAERAAIVQEKFHELPLCIGYVDGTEFKFAEAPIQNPIAYFSRKHIYSIKAQMTCDYKLRIRHALIGSPGSVHDARMFSSCPLATNPSKYFYGDQWIAGDSAYSLTNTVITPYRTNSNAMTATQRKEFNLRHSRYRVRVEHCIGVLKERFGSLKELRQRVSSERNRKFCCQWILVACIIHNILISDDDIPTPSDDNIGGSEDVTEITDAVESHNHKSDIKRQALHKLMFV